MYENYIAATGSRGGNGSESVKKKAKETICQYRRYEGKKDYSCSHKNCILDVKTRMLCKLGRRSQNETMVQNQRT